MPATNKMPDSIRVNLERLREIAGSQKAITMDRLNSKPKCIEGTTFSFHIPLISQYLISFQLIKQLNHAHGRLIPSLQ